MLCESDEATNTFQQHREYQVAVAVAQACSSSGGSSHRRRNMEVVEEIEAEVGVEVL